MPFPGRITLLAPVGDGTAGAGVFVAAGKRTWFLQGTKASEFSQSIKHGWGAVPHSQVYASGSIWGLEDGSDVPCWLDLNGQFCVGLPGGIVRTFNQDTVSTAVGERGASMVRQVDGQFRMVTSVESPVTAMGIRDRLVAKVRRNGIEV